MTVDWIKVREDGLYCEPGDFYIDPWRPVKHAIITHGHADHARPHHEHVLATPGTLAIMQHRFREAAGQMLQSLSYHRTLKIKDITLSFYPAGHVWGSAQVLLNYRGQRVVVSGDYKRRYDPTCEPFEPIPCDVFITEATFGLPIFTHPDDGEELQKLMTSMDKYQDRVHLVGCYALGKCQRLLLRLRQLGFQGPIYLHGALQGLTDLYCKAGFDFGELRLVSDIDKQHLKGQLIMCPPSALADRWSRRFQDPVIGLASGWMRILQRAKQRGIELPLVISDHADWPELTQTLKDVNPQQLWVTHGQEEALIHYAQCQGYEAKALWSVGREREEE
jgi:putative mRNA 3-end processing factor